MLCSVMPGVVYSRGRLIEETEERGRGEGQRGRGVGREKGGENAAPVDFGDISQYCIRICIDFYPLFYHRTEDHI